MKTLTKWFAIGFTILVAGCAATPKPSESSNLPIDEAKAARINVYRTLDSESSAIIDMEVYVNGKKIGLLQGGQTVSTVVNPGQVEVVVLPRYKYVGLTTEYSLDLSFQAKEQQTHYIRFKNALTGFAVYGTSVVPKHDRSLSEASEQEWLARR